MNRITTAKRIELIAIMSGIFLFVLFFVLAAFHYPGGSNFDATSVGYKWNLNYWCELLGDYSKSGVPNTARSYAFVGMIALAVGVSTFWYALPKVIFHHKLLASITSISGILSMFFSAFIFTSLHDLVIYCSVLFGSISFILLFFGIYSIGSKIHVAGGVICLFLIMANCFIYLTELGINHLPSLQKLTFLFTLSWIVLISFIYLRRHESTI